MVEKKKAAQASKPRTITLDAEMVRWLEALKVRYATDDDLVALKRAVLVAHPNIREVAG